MNSIIVIGAGVGGKLAAIGIKNKYPGASIILIGPESKDPQGLFYFNEEIPGITDKELVVSYDKLGDCSFEDYQIKSRGYCDPTVKTSSFNKIGKEEKGYALKELDLSGITWIKSNCESVKYEEDLWKVALSGGVVTVQSQVLISTVPINVFMKLTGRDFDTNLLKYKPVYVLNSELTGYSRDDVTSIEVDYDLREDSPYYRISYYYNSKGHKINTVHESIDINAPHDFTLPLGKIIPSPEVDHIIEELEESNRKLKLLGRYARWDYHYLVTDTYKDAIKFISEVKD